MTKQHEYFCRADCRARARVGTREAQGANYNLTESKAGPTLKVVHSEPARLFMIELGCEPALTTVTIR